MNCQIITVSSLSQFRRAKQRLHTRLAEQRRIVAKLDQLMALVDALETQLAL